MTLRVQKNQLHFVKYTLQIKHEYSVHIYKERVVKLLFICLIRYNSNTRGKNRKPVLYTSAVK